MSKGFKYYDMDMPYEPREPEPAYCDACGKLTDEIAFCSHCGAPLFDPDEINPEDDSA